VDRPLADLTVGVFGLGEAGSEIAADLARLGARVVGFDPADVDTPHGVRRVAEPATAVTGADVIVAVTAAADAPTALAQALDAMSPAAIYADLATASAELKRTLAGTAAAGDLRFVDVALMSTVPGKGVFTPQLAAGPGAEHYVGLLAPAGVPVAVAGDEAGDAATRKLLRSVAVKGVAAVLIESMRAADAAGLGGEVWGNLVEQLTGMDEAFLRRLVTGTGTHARRRLHEMEAARDLLLDLGVDPVLTAATVEHLGRVLVVGVPPLPE